MSDSRVEVSIAADTTELEASLAQAVQALHNAFAAIGAGAQGADGLLRGLVDAIAALQPASANAKRALEDLGQNAAAQMREANRQLQTQTQQLRTLAQLHQITASEEVGAEIGLTNAIFQEEDKRLDAQLHAAALDEQAYKAALDRKAAFEQKWASDIQRLNERAALAAMKDWQSILQPIETGFNSMFRNLLTGSRSFQQNLTQVAGNIVTSFVSARLKIEFDWLAGQLAMALGAQKWAEASLLSWVAAQLGITSSQTASDAAVL